MFMRRWFTRIALSALILLLLSGCITQQTATTVNGDGSGTNVVVMGFTKEFLQQMGDEPLTDVQNQSSGLPAEWNAQAEAWEDDTYKGIKITMQFSNPEMLAAQLNRVLGPDSDSDQSGNGFLDTFNVQQEGNTLIVSTRVKQNQDTTSDDTLPPELFANMKITWSIEMPTIDSYTEEGIATRDGNKVTWNIPFIAERDYNIEVRGTLTGTPNTTPIPEPTQTPVVQANERCFSEVPYCISGRILEYWEQNGGLTVFGLPITPQQEETIDGQPYQVQWFERNRLELHPENQRPYDVLLGRLGVDALVKQGRSWEDFPKDEPQDGCLFFEQSGHTICGDILSAWKASGLETDGVSGYSQDENLALLGLPISGVIAETLGDGKEYQVQYFERARIELHPENTPPYHVLFGLLGNEVRN